MRLWSKELENGIGWKEIKQGDKDKAQELLNRALEIYKEFFGVEHYLTKEVQDYLTNLYSN